MAQRTAAGILPRVAFVLESLRIRALRQAKKQEPIPARAGDFARDCAQGAVMPGFVLEALFEHFDEDLAVVEPAGKQRPRCRQPPVPLGLRAICYPRSTARGIPGQKSLGGARAEVGVTGDFGSSTACAFAQVSFYLRLKAPGDAPKQELFIGGLRFLLKYSEVSCL